MATQYQSHMGWVGWSGFKLRTKYAFSKENKSSSLKWNVKLIQLFSEALGSFYSFHCLAAQSACLLFFFLPISTIPTAEPATYSCLGTAVSSQQACHLPSPPLVLCTAQPEWTSKNANQIMQFPCLRPFRDFPLCSGPGPPFQRSLRDSDLAPPPPSSPPCPLPPFPDISQTGHLSYV